MSSQGNKRILNGRVVSDKMDKTIVVMVERTLMQPVYRKYIKRRKKYIGKTI